MNSRPLVSIITPTYNHEKFIGPCIESVARQTYENWEQIIIDDGSMDNTADVIRGFRDARIRYVRQENAGIEALAHSYNRGLSLCNGEIIAILEGDDLWPPGKLSALVSVFANENIVMAYGAVADVAADGTWHGRLGRSVRKRRGLPNKILFNDPVGSATGYMLRADGLDLVPPSTVLIRRTALASISGFQYVPDMCVTDFPTFVTLSLVGKFYYTPEVMGFRRRHLGSATYNNFPRILKCAQSYAKSFVKTHDVKLTVEEVQAIEKSWLRSMLPVEFTSGRLQLVNGEWRKARTHFVRALNPSCPRIFLAAAAGWTLSWLRCDMEAILALGDVANLRDLRPANVASPGLPREKHNG